MARKLDLIIVNLITLARVPFIFLFLVLALVESRHHSILTVVLATASLATASFTDLFDGMLARKWKVESKFGAMADPLMDKVFYLVVFPTLLYLLGRKAIAQPEQEVHALVMLFFTIMYLLRDQWVTFLRSCAAGYNADVRANWMGKVRTAVSFPAGCIIYVYIAIPPQWWFPLWLIYIIEAVLIVLNTVTIITYTKQYMPYIQRSVDAQP